MRARFVRRGRMRRLIATGLLIVALAPVLWLRSHPTDLAGAGRLRLVEVSTRLLDASKLGPFTVEKVWRIDAWPRTYSGFSALVASGNGRLLALTDAGLTLEFSAPDGSARLAPIGGVAFRGEESKHVRDVEGAAADLATGKVWLSVENTNAIMRYDYRGGRLVDGVGMTPPAMAGWGSNSGPESLVRLADGSFVTLREGFDRLLDRRRHRGVRFPGDPLEGPRKAERFTFVGPRGFSPTDMVALPDGRVLVLLRRVTWPMPPRFAGAIAIGDPATIREGQEWRVRTLASWNGGSPVDNFEALAIEPTDGAQDADRLTVWMMSDDNRAEFQTSLLWKLRLDMKRLPKRRQLRARGEGTGG